MPKNMDDPIDWIGLALVIGMVLIGAIATSNNIKAITDPNDKSRILLEQLPAIALLVGQGVFLVQIFRQSGNLHAQYKMTDAESAVRQAMTTFRRAKIDAILVACNSADELHFNRMIYNHRGSSEGKRIGSVRITRIT